MNKETYMNKKIFFLAFLLTTILSACSPSDDNKTKANTAANSADQTSIVTERAVERWNSLIKKDWKTAYSFESPSYRSTYSVEDFQKSYGNAVTWKSITPKSATLVSNEIIDVSLTLMSSFTDEGFDTVIPTPIKERWKFSDKQWWHIKK